MGPIGVWVEISVFTVEDKYFEQVIIWKLGSVLSIYSEHLYLICISSGIRAPLIVYQLRKYFLTRSSPDIAWADIYLKMQLPVPGPILARVVGMPEIVM
jgi:hypothetical protein